MSDGEVHSVVGGLRLHEPVTLDGLVAKPHLARDLDPDIALALLAEATDQLGRLQMAVSVLAARATAQPREDHAAPEMLTVEQAASIAGMSAEAFLRRSRFRPAVVRLGHRTLRVDERKLRRVLDRIIGS